MKVKVALGMVVVLAVAVRFVGWPGNVYFGWDEARDAYVSQKIYTQQDWKLIGPPANAPGLNHGVLHWYLLGLMYLAGKGNPFIVNAGFRVMNALGVVALYFIGARGWGKRVGVIAAILYALSFEQSQYAQYMGNPSWVVGCWLAMGWGAVSLYRGKKWGLPVMWAGAALAVQFELLEVHALIITAIMTIMLRKQVQWKWLALSAIVVIGCLGSYTLAEVRYGFRGAKAVRELLGNGYNVAAAGESKWLVWWRNWLIMWRDNLGTMGAAILVIASKPVMVWLLSGLWLTLFGAYDAYYTNVGIGLAVIMAGAVFLAKLDKRIIIGALVIIGMVNINRIWQQAPQGLIVEIKASPGMIAGQQGKLISRMYEAAQGQQFTVRATSMPYKNQTVWSYLLRRQDYLPIWETGNIAGYEGSLPTPKNGTTCNRFLIQESPRGIPAHLIEQDIREENYFSDLVSEERFGELKLQIRKAKGECYN